MDARRIAARGKEDRYERPLRVQFGQVSCPRRGLVDVADCWVCPEYRGMADGRVESLMCGLTDDSVASAFWALDWDGPAGGRHGRRRSHA